MKLEHVLIATAPRKKTRQRCTRHNCDNYARSRSRLCPTHQPRRGRKRDTEEQTW